MTGEKGVGWRRVTTMGCHYGATPPLDPSTRLRVSGPTWGWIHASAHLQHLRPARGGGNTGEKGVGWRRVTTMGCHYGAAPPLDPSTRLRVSGPTWGWIHALAHATGALTASLTGLGGGMTGEEWVGWRRVTTMGSHNVATPLLDPSTRLRVSGPTWGWIHASGHATGALTASLTGSEAGMTGEKGVGWRRVTMLGCRSGAAPPLDPSTRLRVSGPTWGWIPARGPE